MVEHLGLDSKGVLNDDRGLFDEASNTLEEPEQMRVVDAAFPLPAHALAPGSAVAF